MRERLGLWEALRARWGLWVSGVILGVVIFPGATASTEAHQIDEYVGLTHIRVEPNRIELMVSLTPGADVAEAVIARADQDGDGELTPDERQAYATRILRNLRLTIDGEPVEGRLVRLEFPQLEFIRLGRGIIQMDIEAIIGPLSPGEHRVVYRNENSDELSVFLVNALRPASKDIRVKKQTRDWLQTQIEVLVDVRLSQPDEVGHAGRVVTGVIASVGILASLVLARRIRRRRLSSRTP